MNLKKVIYPKLGSIKPILDELFVPIYKIRKVPFSLGYNTSKWQKIKQDISNKKIIESFSQRNIPLNFGIGFDERIVEYPWLFSEMPANVKTVLDAGSTFNFKPIVEHSYFRDKNLNIFTFYPEPVNFPSESVSYEYGDIRSMPYNNSKFDVVVSHSTVEHIDMDNSIYGYEISHNTDQKKSFEYLKAIKELKRVLKSNGTLLITFPYGKFKNYGFFQQFDKEMVSQIEKELQPFGKIEFSFLKYTGRGWQFDAQTNCDNSTSHNPHTGEDKGTDGAAHCRCVCCIRFIKN